MQFSVKDKRKIVLRVVFRRQIALFFRTIGRPTFARVVNPANDVIEVCFLADLLKIRGKGAAHLAVVFAD